MKYLASPELKGRGSGQPGLEKAARYIENQFSAIKLQPIPGRRYSQPFSVTTDAHLGRANRLEAGRTRLQLKQDFVPFNFSGGGSISGPLVFAGYGITAPEYHYDDYEGIDATGKVVLVLRHEPQELDEKSVFAGKALTAHAQFWSKAVNAKRHGAVAVILVNDRPNHPGRRDDLEEFGHAAGPVDAGIGLIITGSLVAIPASPVSGFLRDELLRAAGRVSYGQMSPEASMADARGRVQEQLDLVYARQSLPLFDWKWAWGALVVVIAIAVVIDPPGALPRDARRARRPARP